MEKLAMQPLKASDATLIIGKDCESIGLYDRANHKMHFGIGLKNEKTDKYCLVTVYLTAANEIMLEHCASAPVQKYTVDFTKSYSEIWIDESSIIIGTGDLRNGIFSIKRYDLKHHPKGKFVIGCGDLNVLDFYADPGYLDSGLNHDKVTCNA